MSVRYRFSFWIRLLGPVAGLRHYGASLLRSEGSQLAGPSHLVRGLCRDGRRRLGCWGSLRPFWILHARVWGRHSVQHAESDRPWVAVLRDNMARKAS